ncbi:hypothetical protein [Pseudooctadecabacter sp.]|uniref:hypothetical protein n=1 Tax=Pseudooctadecabacter sp. TaxID=1966338 RepID=UPI0025CE51C3|nr:hypothetical protein [Pseudooctadecabacter sp.]
MSSVRKSELPPDASADVPPKDVQPARQVDNPKLARFLDLLDREMGRDVPPTSAE